MMPQVILVKRVIAGIMVLAVPQVGWEVVWKRLDQEMTTALMCASLESCMPFIHHPRKCFLHPYGCCPLTQVLFSDTSSTSYRWFRRRKGAIDHHLSPRNHPLWHRGRSLTTDLRSLPFTAPQGLIPGTFCPPPPLASHLLTLTWDSHSGSSAHHTDGSKMGQRPSGSPRRQRQVGVSVNNAKYQPLHLILSSSDY